MRKNSDAKKHNSKHGFTSAVMEKLKPIILKIFIEKAHLTKIVMQV